MARNPCRLTLSPRAAFLSAFLLLAATAAVALGSPHAGLPGRATGIQATNRGPQLFAREPIFGADKGGERQIGKIRREPGAPDWPKDFNVGLEAACAFALHFGLVQEDSLLQRLDRIGYRVASQCGHPEILFTFHILDTPEPNALALPGGFIFVTRGMMDLHLPDAVLAQLVGHEIAHVTENHFSRAGKVSGAISLLQTAAFVAALLAVPYSSSGGYDRDPETGLYRGSWSGRDAAVQGVNIFGSVFKELLVRGYSRNLEMEADEVGRRYAGRAGYPAAGSVQLMEELHRRIYEDMEFGYWRTHPYFNDRVTKARVSVDAGGSAPPRQEVDSYRASVQQRLARIAASIENEPIALFVYYDALAAGPGGDSSAEVELKLLQMRAERLRRRNQVTRAYTPLIADYDALISRLQTLPDGSRTLQRARSDRDALVQERRELHGSLLSIIKKRQAGTSFLELFLINFPDDPEAPAVRLRLAEQYRLSDRPDDAALVLAGLSVGKLEDRAPLDSTRVGRVELPTSAEGGNAGKDAPGSDSTAAPPSAITPEDWNAQFAAALHSVLPLTRELTTNQRILLAASSDSVRHWATERLKAQAAGLDSLELGSQFLQEYPVSHVSDEVRQKVDELSMKRYYQARLSESLRDYQAALDGYNELILLAPRTKAAELSREGVARVQSLGNL